MIDHFLKYKFFSFFGAKIQALVYQNQSAGNDDTGKNPTFNLKKSQNFSDEF